MITWLRTHWKLTLPAALGVLAVGAYLVFGVFGLHLLFVDDEVNEAAPVFSSGAAAAEVAEPAPVEEPAADATPPDTAEAENEIVTLLDGSFIDRSHPTSGTATVLNDGSEQRFLRFEDFETDNGPDLDVYLTTASPDAGTGDIEADFISLGDLKGNVGPQNYEIDPSVDLDEYSTVVIWCTRFSVAFGAAELTAA